MTIIFWIIDLLIPTIMIMLGAYFGTKPPKNINNFAGYRTRLSKLSQKTWNYANKRCGLLYCKIGLVLLILIVVVKTLILIVDARLFTQDAEAFFMMICALATMIGCIIPLPIVESKLRKEFDNNGNEKSS